MSPRWEVDCLVVGGGVIGLSIAWELAQADRSVLVLDRRTTPHIASWAAGGILPPAISRAVHDPMEQLRSLSHRIYPDWLDQLTDGNRQEIEYEHSGGIYLARSIGERVALQAALDQWQHDGVVVEPWSMAELQRREPNLAKQPDSATAYFLPDEVRVRPTRILKALTQKLSQVHVPVMDVERVQWDDWHGTTLQLHTESGGIAARCVCIAAGPWSPELLTPLGIDLPVEPRRGQMVMWKSPQPLLRYVINEGPRYLIPRNDGHLLAGSTVEEVGFDGSTTDEAIRDLTAFAESLVPQLQQSPPVQSWAGLRPWSIDGMPYLGIVPGLPRISLATGHFRSGIHLAPATALLVKELVCDEPRSLSLEPFSVER